MCHAHLAPNLLRHTFNLHSTCSTLDSPFNTSLGEIAAGRLRCGPYYHPLRTARQLLRSGHTKAYRPYRVQGRKLNT